MRLSRIPRAKIQKRLLLALVAFTSLASACRQGKPSVELGAVLPLTGGAQGYGESIQRGIELAAEQVALDESLAYEVRVAFHDTGSDPEQAAALASQLFRTDIAIVGGVTSDEALAMIDPLKRTDKVLLSPSASSPELSNIAPGKFFRIFPSAEAETTTMVNFADKTLKAREIALLAQDDANGRGFAAELEEVAVTLGVTVAPQLTFPGGTLDFSELVAEIMASGIKTAYVAASGPDLAHALQALRDGGFGGQGYRILSSSAVASPAVLEAAGRSAWGVYYTQTSFDASSDQEPVKSFVEAYRARFGQPPDLYAACGYDAIHVLVQALREGGATLPSDFQKGMRAIQNLPGVTGSIQFRESGDVQQFTRVFYVHEGKLVEFEPWWAKQREELQERMEEIRRRREELLREANR